MRILFVTDLYPVFEDNKTSKIVEDFALAFKQKGYEVGVICPNFLLNFFIRGKKYARQGQYKKNNIKIYNRNFILPFLDGNVSFLQERYDLIISHMPSGHIYADLINKKMKLAHISIIHQSDDWVLSDFKYSFYFKNRLQKALRNSNLIGARNKFLKEKYKATFLLPSFIEKERIVKQKELKKDKLKIITFSKLIKRKNIDLVIKALAEVDFDFEYSIFGQGREQKKLEKLIKKYNLINKIKIYPYIKHEYIWDKLDENNVFILPSVNETFGISYLEAMARGLVVVGVKNTGIDGVIENNRNGFLIEAKKEEIKNVLEKINKENMDGIIAQSLLNIQKYTKEEIMNKYDEIIKKIL